MVGKCVLSVYNRGIETNATREKKMKKYKMKEQTGGIHKDENGNTIMKTLKGWKRWGKQFTKGQFNVIHVSLWLASDELAVRPYDFVTVNISSSETY